MAIDWNRIAYGGQSPSDWNEIADDIAGVIARHTGGDMENHAAMTAAMDALTMVSACMIFACGPQWFDWFNTAVEARLRAVIEEMEEE